MKYFKLIFRNLRRNLVRTLLTAMGTLVLVFVLTLIWSVLYYLDSVTQEKNQNFKLIITEKWQVPSQMPQRYAPTLCEAAARQEGDLRPLPDDTMTWAFFGGSTQEQKEQQTIDNMVFMFALEPRKLALMMDDLDQLQGADRADLEETIAKMEADPQGIILGRQVLTKLNKRVGESIRLYGTNYRDITCDFHIVGSFPARVTRYDQSAAMNDVYLRRILEQYERTHGERHEMADKSLALVWLRVKNRADFERIAEQLEQSPALRNPPVKCETASAGIANFLEAYRDLIWGMRYLLSPAIVITLSLVISNSISISVRERRREFAVLKVLGFRPRQILLLVLGEAVLIGLVAGMLSAGVTYYGVNQFYGGIKFPISFIPVFFVPSSSLGWGIGVGALTAVLGSMVPAWGAQRIRVAEVFSKVA